MCVITHLTNTNLPTNTAYTIFDPTPLLVDVSTPGFNQVPNCGYYLFKTFTWDIPSGAPAITAISDNSYGISVKSTDANHAGTPTVTLNISALHGATLVTYTNSVTFTVTLTDPCLTTIITNFSLPNKSMQTGQSVTWNYQEPTHSAGNTVSD